MGEPIGNRKKDPRNNGILATVWRVMHILLALCNKVRPPFLLEQR